MTQSEMAEKIGLSLRGYQRLEAAEIIPQQATLTQIASKLDVSEIDLFQNPERIPNAPKPTPLEAWQIVGEHLRGEEETRQRPTQSANELSTDLVRLRRDLGEDLFVRLLNAGPDELKDVRVALESHRDEDRNLESELDEPEGN